MYCKKCETEKDEEDFNWKIKNVQRQSKCRVCQRAYVSTWYRVPENTASSKKRAVVNNSNNRNRNREFILSYLKENGCVDCGNTDVRVLEFDHLKDKLYAVSDMIRTAYSIKKIKEEIEKCDVVCANCHRIRTYTR